jgi:hypothetical protein
MKRILLSAALLALGAAASADKVYRKDGSVLEGTVVEETETHVKLKMKMGVVPIPKADIDRVEKGESPVGQLEAKLEALTPAAPADYLSVAEWCVRADPVDLALVDRLTNIAIGLDPALCGRGNAILGDCYAKKNARGEAAECYLRAFLADWKNDEYRRKFLDHRSGLEEVQKNQVRRLRDAMTLALENKLAEALPGLRASKNAPAANLISAYNPKYASFAAFLTDVESRVPCKSCSGTGLVRCVTCSGSGKLDCPGCHGKKKKEIKKNGKVIDTVNCDNCDGKGYLSCTRCLGKAVANPRPGRVKCGTCKGVIPEKSSIVWDKAKLTAFRNALDQRMGGSLPVEEQVGPKLPRLGTVMFDTSYVDDGKVVYSKGRWVDPDEKK